MTRGSSAKGPGAWMPLAIYLPLQLFLLFISLVLSPPVDDAVRRAAFAAGALVLAIEVARRRPRPVGAFAFMAAAGLAHIAADIAVAIIYGLGTPTKLSGLVVVILTALVLPLSAVGMLLLSRATRYGGVADGLDAAMTASGGFLLVWAFIVEPNLGAEFNVGAAAVYAGSVFFLLAISVKVALGGGLEDPALRILLLAIGLLLAAAVSALLPALRSDVLSTSTPTSMLLAAYGVSLGALGLHPRLTRSRDQPKHARGELSLRRMALDALLALLTPLVWGVERFVYGPDVGVNMIGFSVPVVTSGVLLLLLVARLTLASQVAQSRAQVLARRSAELAAAVSDQKELQARLSYQALHDPLTGLANRAVLTRCLEELAQHTRDDGHFALLLLDLDGFKEVNDTLGHPIGDELLVQLSSRLRECAPPDAIVSRLGGDEFAVILQKADPRSAQDVAGRLLTAAGKPYRIKGRELLVTASIGVLVDGWHRRPAPSDLLRDADLALYAAKDEGKNRIRTFDSRLEGEQQEHDKATADLHRALANDEFILHYQPVIELATQRIRMVEALLRWRPDGSRPLPPERLISIAEGTGFIIPIGAWVLSTALNDAQRWYETHRISVAVTVSGQQLEEPDFARGILKTLGRAGLPGEALVIEITEDVWAAYPQSHSLRRHLQHLRAAGVRVAIDDFGTGGAPLSNVVERSVDAIKIDKSFIQAPAGPAFSWREWGLTTAVLQMVGSIGVPAVAQGVETIAQANALRIIGCPLAQGGLFARPMSAEAISRMLEGNGPTIGGYEA